MARPLQGSAHLLRRTRAQQAAAVHHRHPGRQREGVPQTMLRQDHRGPKLPVDPPDGRQEVRGGDRVELAGGLVQDEHAGLHGHHRRQIQELFLAAGELRHVFIKPGLDTEKGGHLRHPPPDGGRVVAQALQTEGQFVPYLVRHHLVFRALQHESDPLALGPLVQAIQRLPLEEYLTLPVPVGRQHCLELAQQRGLSAPGGAAEHQELPPRHPQVQPFNGRLCLLRIVEGQAFNRKYVVHSSSSRVSRPHTRVR